MKQLFNENLSHFYFAFSEFLKLPKPQIETEIELDKPPPRRKQPESKAVQNAAFDGNGYKRRQNPLGTPKAALVHHRMEISAL